MERKLLYKIFIINMAIFWLAMPTWAASIPDEAQRHFDRGMAAVKMAQTPEDYDLAIAEFQKAQILAPEWPDVYYNLGLIEEKTGKYHDAANTLRRFLQMVPDSADAATVRTLANKAEFKAEQLLTDDDILNIFASLADNSQWELHGIKNANLFQKDKWPTSIKKSGNG